MSPKDYTKLELMLYAINSDFFSYGSTWRKRKDGKYVISCLEGSFTYTANELITDFDGLDLSLKRDIVEEYLEKVLIEESIKGEN